MSKGIIKFRTMLRSSRSSNDKIVCPNCNKTNKVDEETRRFITEERPAKYYVICKHCGELLGMRVTYTYQLQEPYLAGE
jgi:transcription elongation factor Elf1